LILAMVLQKAWPNSHHITHANSRNENLEGTSIWSETLKSSPHLLDYKAHSPTTIYLAGSGIYDLAPLPKSCILPLLHDFSHYQAPRPACCGRVGGTERCEGGYMSTAANDGERIGLALGITVCATCFPAMIAVAGTRKVDAPTRPMTGD